MSVNTPTHSFQRFNITSGWEPVETRVIIETAVSLSVNGNPWLSFTCTPADLNALAVGFLFNEHILQRRDELVSVDVCKQGTQVDVWLTHTVERPTQWQRTSGCTGGHTSVAIKQPEPVERLSGVPSGSLIPLDPISIIRGMEQLMEAQELYRESGGVHCSAISDGTMIRLQAEDIGRHNTLDKLSGMLLLSDLQVTPAVVLTTGRVSSEMLQKSARMGASIVASRTSPTSQSVKLAEAMGISLIGYARRNGFMVYTHPDRLTG